MGLVVGLSERCDHELTYKALNAKTLKVVHRSLLCRAAPDDINMRDKSLGGKSNDVIQNRNDIDNKFPDPKHLIALTTPPIVNPDKRIRQIPHGCTTRWQYILRSHCQND
jgi:hypothetical protein